MPDVVSWSVCPNTGCALAGTRLSDSVQCPSCLTDLVPVEASEEVAAVSAPAAGTPEPGWLRQLCYCADPRDEHAGNLGQCLMVRDGVRCDCQRFERHDEPAGEDAWTAPLPQRARAAQYAAREAASLDTPPLTLLSWGEDDRTMVHRLRTSTAGSAARREAEETRDAVALEDPVIRHLQAQRMQADIHDKLVDLLAAVERLPEEVETKLDTSFDAVASEITQKGPSSLRSVEEAVDDVRSVLVAGLDPRDWTSVLITLLRTAIVAGGVCAVLAFGWWLVGVSTLAGVIVP